jgi:hypothetical protein
MEFSDGLTDNGERGGGAGARGELLVDVESGLVLLTTLNKKKFPVSLLIQDAPQCTSEYVQLACQPRTQPG